MQPKTETLLPPELAVAATKAAGVPVDEETVRAASHVNHAAGTTLLGSIGRTFGFSSAPKEEPAAPSAIATTPRTARRLATANDPKLGSPSNEDPVRRSICIRRIKGYSKVKRLADAVKEFVPSNYSALPLVRLEELCSILDREMGYNHEYETLKKTFILGIATYEQQVMQYAPAPYNMAWGVSAVASAAANDEESELHNAIERMSLLHMGTLEMNAYAQLAFAAFSLVSEVAEHNVKQLKAAKQAEQQSSEDGATSGIL